MLYELPDVRYVDMCIYIDNTVYKDVLTEEEETLIFQYLFFLCHMFASKGKFFEKAQYYDDFSVYCATKIFLRLRNPKQFQYDENGNPKLRRVKSVLNYIKSIIDARRVDFQQEFYAQLYQPDDVDDLIVDTEYRFADMLSDSIDALSIVEFNTCLGDIIQTARAFLKDIPYYSNKHLWENIYTSCILTFLNQVTVRNKELKRVQKLKSELNNDQIERLYRNESKSSTILYHLDESMRDYVTVLVRELKHVIAKDLSLYSDTYIPCSNSMRLLLDAELQGGTVVGEK